MQCVNCGFENLPGIAECVRCQSIVTLGDVDVIPGRASVLRLRTRLGRIRYGLETRIRRFGGGILDRLPRWRPLVPERMGWKSMALTLVPGLGHLCGGERRLGWVLITTWMAFLFLGIAAFPTYFSQWCFAGMVAVHATAIVSLFAANLNYERFVIRALFGIFLFTGLQNGPYRWLSLLRANFVVGLMLDDSLPPDWGFQRGDGILVAGPWLQGRAFSKGDLVLHRISLDPAPESGLRFREGLGLDPIVGVPGDKVTVCPKGLLINGVPVEPIGNLRHLTANLQEERTYELGESEYAVCPRSMRIVTGGHFAFGPELPLSLVIRPRKTVIGSPLLRIWPWARFKVLPGGE